MKKYNYFNIFVVISLIFLCIGLTHFPISNDTFYNIKIGNWILQNGIDMQDHFSWISNLPYTYPHWLFDVFTAIVYNFSNFKGLYILTIIFYFAIGLLIYFFSKERTKNYFFSFVLTLIIICSLAPFMTIRAQIISFIIFLLEKYFLDKFLLNGNKKYAFIIILLSLILVNVHLATWIFFFVLFIPPIVNHYFTLIIKKIRKNDADFTIGLIEFKTNKNVKKLFLIIFLCLLTGFLTPLNTTPYTYIFKQFLGNSLGMIDEFKNLTISNCFNFFEIILILLFGFLLTKKTISFEDLLLILGLSLMSLVSIRNEAYFLLICIFPISNYLGKVYKNLKKKSKEKINLIFLNKSRLVILTIFFIIFGLSISSKQYLNNNFITEKVYPTKVVNYLKENLHNDDRIFNEYEIGSYLLFNDIKVFIDSRSDLYTKPFNKLDHDIFNDYIKASEYMEYEEVFEYYNITHVVLLKNSPLAKILLKDCNYQEMYSDKNFLILKRLTKNDI